MNGVDHPVLREIGFGYLLPYRVAGMAEPWVAKMETTLRLLREAGIGAILSLTEENLYGGRYLAAGFRHHHEPIEDCEPPSPEGMDRAIAFIESCLGEGQGVAVHCLEGRGRTATVLAAWLARRESLDVQEAIRRLVAARERTAITPSQRAFLERYLEAPAGMPDADAFGRRPPGGGRRTLMSALTGAGGGEEGGMSAQVRRPP